MMLKFRTDTWHLIDDVHDLGYEIGFREWPPETGPQVPFPELFDEVGDFHVDDEIVVALTREGDNRRNPDGTRIVRAFTFRRGYQNATGRYPMKAVVTDAQPVYVLNDQGDTIDRI